MALLSNKKSNTRSLSPSLIIDSLAILLFRRRAEQVVKKFRLDESIERAGMNIHPVLYVSRLLLIMLLIGLFFGVISIIVFIVSSSIIIKVLAILVAAFAPLLVFGIGISYPSAKASSRANAVDNEFPFFAAYMTAMAYAGVAPEKVIERLAELRVFKALREEALRILRDVKIFGKDVLSALERNAASHPSRMYRDFMLGYLTTIRTGGDIRHFLEIRTQELFQARMEDLRSRAERVGLVVEAYAAVAVLGTLSFYIFFVVSGIIGSGGFAGINGILLYTLIVLPALTAAIISMLDSLIPGQERIREPYAYLLISATAGLITIGVLLSITGALSAVMSGKITRSAVIELSTIIGLGLFIISVIPGLVFLQRVRRERAIVRALASFFRDLSEIRRTGLSPEKSLIILSQRNYGQLTDIIKRIAGAVSVGLHIERAARRALRGYTNWILRVSMRFLVDAIDVGGGSATTIDAIARFITSLIDIQESLRRRLRPYIVMPYFGAVLVAVSSVLTLLMLSQSLSSIGIGGGTVLHARISAQTINELLLIASIGSIVNAWLSGIVAGKIQDQSVASGFLHASLLTILTLVSLILSIKAAPGFVGSMSPP